jgi:urease subunit alpha
MVANAATPVVVVPTEPGPVLVDGRPVPVHRASDLPLTRLHHLA